MSANRRRPTGKEIRSSDDLIGGSLTGSRSLLDRAYTEATTPAPAIYDWNGVTGNSALRMRRPQLCDDTLRDGIQSPSVADPHIDEKIELMRLMDLLGIDSIIAGLPAAGSRAYNDSLALVHAAVDNQIKARINLAARTLIDDVKPIVDIVQKTGRAVTAYTFIGSSPIRLFVEDWTVETLLTRVEESVSFAVREGIDVCLVTEDTTRARPDVLEPLYRTAIDLGAKRLCLCDTVGHATPDGVRSLVGWIRNLVRQSGATIELDWHGHNDRGLAVANSLAALEAGVDCVHGTALGIGERVGNASMDQLLINLKLAGAYQPSIDALDRYRELASRACKVPIPVNDPGSGATLSASEMRAFPDIQWLGIASTNSRSPSGAS
jgi:2-isopropylmalate synthase